MNDPKRKPVRESLANLAGQCTPELLHHLPQDSDSAEAGARKVAALVIVQAWMSARITVCHAAEAIAKAAKPS